MRNLGKARKGDILRRVKRGRKYVLYYDPPPRGEVFPVYSRFVVEVCEEKTGKALFVRRFPDQIKATLMFDLLFRYGNAEKFISSNV